MNLKRVLFLLSSTLLFSCSNESIAVDKEDTVSEEEIVEQEVVEELEEEKVLDIPEESQQTAEFPWDEDEDFKNIQVENDMNVLIAGYATVFEKSTPEERENIMLAAEAMNGTILNPGEVFSQNETAGPYTEERGYKEGLGYVGSEPVKDFGGGVCKVATTLFNTSIVSNLEIVERHNHSMPVAYVPYGQDAAVAYGYLDFKFRNSTEDPMLIWAELVDNVLYMAFYGKEEAPEVIWEHETLSETETTTEYKTNSELDKGNENILIEGMDGRIVHSILKITNKNGEEHTIDRGQSTYAPLKTIIEINE